MHLMQFILPDEKFAFAAVVLGHVGMREFRRILIARYDSDTASCMDLSYQYAVIRDDESILLNVRPDETGAKPVTIAYFKTKGPYQL